MMLSGRKATGADERHLRGARCRIARAPQALRRRLCVDARAANMTDARCRPSEAGLGDVRDRKSSASEREHEALSVAAKLEKDGLR